MIRIENLRKKFGENIAIDNISAQLLPGKITGIVGPDGAGKTTLVRLIAGLLIPSKGNISIFDLDSVKDTPAIREILGYMPQRFGLYEDLSVLENLRLYAEMRGLDKVKRKDRFEQLLDFTGLQPFTARLAGRLSGGMKQKLGLACALVKMPKLLLLDEPGVGVDPISRRELWRMVRALVADDVLVLWNTAYLDEAEACDDVLLLNFGKQLFHGAPSELTQRMQDRVVQVRGLPANERRKVLAQILQLPETLDGTIQGNALRIVVKSSTKNESPEQRDDGAKTYRQKDPVTALRSVPGFHSSLKIIPVPSRFEDGFINILGGLRKEASKLSRSRTDVYDTDTPVVVAHGLTKRFGSFTAVRNNNFEIHRGEIFGLLGPNGAGKSTTFKMLCGLLKPTEGEGFIAGYNLRKSPSRARSRLGYMAQKFSMYGDLTVRQNLNFFAGTYGLWGFAKHRAVDKMLDIFDLRQYASSGAATLPLGFKQRLSLAAALMHEPDVLFLDEPTSGVDPLTRREFWNHINALVEGGVTVLVTTHFMDEAEYCDRIALIYHGETIALGTPDELKMQCRTTERSDPTLEDAFIAIVQSRG